MIEIRNKIIPFKGFIAMTIWPFLFIRESNKLSPVVYNHEKIHGYQQREMLLFGVLITLLLFVSNVGWWSFIGLPIYYWWYVIEWIYRSIQFKSFKEGYRNISFERESKFNERNMYYTDIRCSFDWIKYM